MFEFTDIFLQKRRSAIVSAVVTIILLLVCLLAQVVQTYRVSIAAQVKTSSANQMSQSMDDSSNAVTNALSQIVHDIVSTTNAVEVSILSGIMSFSNGVKHFENDSTTGTRSAVMFTLHGARAAVFFTLHGVSRSVTDTTNIFSSVFAFTGHTIGNVFAFTGHRVSSAFRFLSEVTHASALIRPPDYTPTPTIKKMRAQEASIIQSGTIPVAAQATQAAQAISIGIGGACDSGEGNGGYPINWCKAPMDSIPTVSYSSDPINRECTSYAFWYFTNVEGHANFHASGNAKFWAATSNYPTHAAPAVGAISVETAGAYGHVAIVQALPGQVYDGRVVPTGYVLVSEMNYDWNGHFRYSYSPLSKFSAYIYP